MDVSLLGIKKDTGNLQNLDSFDFSELLCKITDNFYN